MVKVMMMMMMMVMMVMVIVSSGDECQLPIDTFFPTLISPFFLQLW